MEEFRCNPAEIISIAYSDKKRKLGDEQQLETPLPKHIRIDSNTEAKKEERNELEGGFESEPESINSNSINDSDSMMSTDPESPNTYTSGSLSSLAATSSEPLSDSLSSLAATSSKPLYSSKTTSSTISISINLGFSFDHQEIEIKNMLYSNRVAPTTNFILSSKRWSVNQDAQQECKKLTIDKEFEHYFSKLML